MNTVGELIVRLLPRSARLAIAERVGQNPGGYRPGQSRG